MYTVLNNLFCIFICVIPLIWTTWPIIFLDYQFSPNKFTKKCHKKMRSPFHQRQKFHQPRFTSCYNISVRFLSKQKLFFFFPDYYTRSLWSIYLLLCDFSNFYLSVCFECKTCWWFFSFYACNLFSLPSLLFWRFHLLSSSW